MVNQKILILLTLLGLSTTFSVLLAQDTLLKARYVILPYSLISDEEAPLTSADFAQLKSAIKKLKQVYCTSFDINFTSKDSLKTYQLLKKKSQNFANSFQDTSLFFQNGGQRITLNYQLSLPYSNKPIGSTITFITDGDLYVSKIIGKTQIADSVHARHILFKGAKENFVEKILNDLKNKKISWENANETYNIDLSAAQKGGDLGYFKQGDMVESFDKLCFEIANIGEFHRVETRFGIHIVQVLDKKMSGNSTTLQTLSYVSPVILSQKTLKKVEAKAQRKIGKSRNIDELENKLLKEGIQLEILPKFQQYSGEIAQWTSQAKNGDITLKPIKTYDNFTQKNKLMILGMRITQGSDISQEYLTKHYGSTIQNKKKEPILYQRVKAFKSLESIAAKYDVEIKEISLPFSENISSVDEMITDNSIQKKLFNYPVNKLSEPIIGFNGIYVAYIFWKK